MPRIYDPNNTPLDYCRSCFPSGAATKAKYGDVVFDYDADHPAYEGDLGAYGCATCGAALTKPDN